MLLDNPISNVRFFSLANRLFSAIKPILSLCILFGVCVTTTPLLASIDSNIKISQIDKKLSLYYTEKGKTDYLDDDNKGKFLLYGNLTQKNDEKGDIRCTKISKKGTYLFAKDCKEGEKGNLYIAEISSGRSHSFENVQAYEQSTIGDFLFVKDVARDKKGSLRIIDIRSGKYHTFEDVNCYEES
ncbi:MAG: hypothetical protein AAF335_02130, partial [Bacteroidota bacterium]